MPGWQNFFSDEPVGNATDMILTVSGRRDGGQVALCTVNAAGATFLRNGWCFWRVSSGPLHGDEGHALSIRMIAALRDREPGKANFTDVRGASCYRCIVYSGSQCQRV
jgi:hypothetical protein